MNTKQYTVLNTATDITEHIERTIALLANPTPHVWISILDADSIRRQAFDVIDKLESGENLPLAGVTVAVKDNIDVEGLPTTCAAPWTAHVPQHDATCVSRLREAGAIILGKTNMDQFATGLVGTRSPYGAVGCVDDPSLVSGGSSSGSSVAVASGVADIALGTDTAGSGRVPAAFNRIYGIKPTVGMIPVTGVTPACPSYDVVSVFCRDLSLGQRALSVMAGPDGKDSHARAFSSSAPLAASAGPVLLAPLAKNIEGIDPRWRSAFDNEIRRFESLGYQVRHVDVNVLLEAAKLLYGGALVAERFASIGDRYAKEFNPTAGEDETVRRIVLDAGELTAADFVNDQERLKRAKLAARRVMSGGDILVLPTTTRHPSIAQVEANPVSVNSDLGRFTNFVNLLDFSAVAVPAGVDSFVGITLLGEAFHDYALIDFAERVDVVVDYSATDPEPVPDNIGTDLFVVGEHMRGLSLNRQLTDLGARFVGEVVTAPSYSLVRLDTNPAKPTIVRRASGKGGRSIQGELWRMPVQSMTHLLESLPHPMTLGPVDLLNGNTVVGFSADAMVFEESEDISSYSGWREYKSSVSRAPMVTA